MNIQSSLTKVGNVVRVATLETAAKQDDYKLELTSLLVSILNDKVQY